MFQYDFGNDGVVDVSQTENFVTKVYELSYLTGDLVTTTGRGYVQSTSTVVPRDNSLLDLANLTVSTKDSNSLKLYNNSLADSAFISYVHGMLQANRKTYTVQPVVEKVVGEIGSWKDARDNKVYPWRRIGSQIWMLKNMAWDPGDGSLSYKIHNGGDSLGGQMGFYDSVYAVQACPEGWRLPKEDDWYELIKFVDLTQTTQKNMNGFGNPYRHFMLLGAANSWHNYNEHGIISTESAPTNDYGFAAYPVGFAYRRVIPDSVIAGYNGVNVIGPDGMPQTNYVPYYSYYNHDTTDYYESFYFLIALYWAKANNDVNYPQTGNLFYITATRESRTSSSVLNTHSYASDIKTALSAGIDPDKKRVLVPVRCIFGTE